MDNVRKGNELEPPRWMSRSEKKAFRGAIAERKARDLPVSSADVALIEEYVAAMARIEVLEMVFSDDTAAMRRTRDGRVKARLVATARQIDAATKAAQAMRDRLLPPPEAPGGTSQKMQRPPARTGPPRSNHNARPGSSTPDE